MMVVAVGLTSEVLNPPSQEAVSQTGAGLRGSRISRLLNCVVVSGDASRRNRFEAAADLAGWGDCSAPTSTKEAIESVGRDVSLAIVDIACPIGDRVVDAVAIAEELASRPGTLLVICGSEDSVDEELWARQLGAWLYLPGVCDGDSLTSLCVEARRLREGAVVSAA